MAEAFLRSKITMMVATKEQQATEATASVQGAAVTQASMLKEQFAAAKAGAAKAYQAMAGIPLIGPELGAVAAAATFTAIMAFEKGGIVPKDSPALLHANEMVLPAHISEGVQRATSQPGGMGGGHTFHFHHHGPGTDAGVKSASKQFMREAVRELRRRGMSVS